MWQVRTRKNRNPYRNAVTKQYLSLAPAGTTKERRRFEPVGVGDRKRDNRNFRTKNKKGKTRAKADGQPEGVKGEKGNVRGGGSERRPEKTNATGGKKKKGSGGSHCRKRAGIGKVTVKRP